MIEQYRSRPVKSNLSIVLDLDATLISTQDPITQKRFDEIYNSPTIRNKMYILDMNHETEYNSDKKRKDRYMWGIKRPHSDEFLNFCSHFFVNVIVWSAGEYDYVHRVVEDIFKNRKKPSIIWTRDNCVIDDDGFYTKPLKVLCDSDEGKSLNLKLDKLLILDDNKDTFKYNINNAIHIPKFDPKRNKNGFTKNDACLIQFMNWIKLHPRCYDIREVNKSSIFL